MAAFVDPVATLYTRQQLAALAGLDDTTLNYWSREGLLVPTEGGGGRGSHRRFDFLQVNIAAILSQLRHFRLGISVMRPFAELLQEAVALGRSCKLHPGNYSYAARLATSLGRFRSGESVPIRAHKDTEERPPGLRGPAYGEWLTAKRPAESEAEIIEEQIGLRNDYDSIEAIIDAAEIIGPGRDTPAQIYAELVYDLIVPGYSDAYSWLLGFNPDGSWKIEFGSEGAKFFDRISGPSAEDFGPGIFLPVSGILRRVWKLRTPTEYMLDRQAEAMRLKLAEAGIIATVSHSGSRDDGFTIEAPGVEWDVVEATLARPGPRPTKPRNHLGLGGEK